LKSKHEPIERADIISIVWFKIFPARFGGQKGIALFTNYLSQYFSILCLCSIDNSIPEVNYPVKPVLPSGKKQFFIPSTYRKTLRLIKQCKCKYLLLEHCYYGIAGVFFKRSLKKFLIVHSHNIEYLRFQEQGNWWWPILYQLEKYTYGNADLVLFKTEEDCSFAVEKFKLKSKTLIVPYGIERQIIDKQKCKVYLQQTHSISPENKILLFAATLDYLPNAQAVEFIYSTIAPALECLPYTILICGRNKIKGFEYLSRLKALNVIYCGEVTNISDYFSGADVFIDPVNIVAGVQTKILDALSFDLNVVCFKHALNGIDQSVTGEKIFIADNNDSNQFNELIKKASQVNSQIPEAFFSTYEWDHIAKHTAQAIRDINFSNE
jgi:hypothetical protein